MCKKCMSFDHFLKKALSEDYSMSQILNEHIVLEDKGQTYIPLIGDVCYRFKRESKEKFFKDKLACRLFLIILPFLRKKAKVSIEQDILSELETVAQYYMSTMHLV